MPRYRDFEAWVAVDGNCDYEVGCSREEAADRLEVAHSSKGEPLRVVCIKLRVPVPEIINLEATIPADDSPVAMRIS